MGIEGQVAFVTGAGRGQGRAHARTLARNGASVVITDIGAEKVSTVPYPLSDSSDLEETKRLVEEEEGGRVLTVNADVRVQADLDRAVELAIDGFGGIDILIANAGVWSMGPFWELSDQQWDDVMSVNLSGVWRTTKAVAPHMIGRRSGSIVMTSSINGFEAAAQWAHYAAAKHGVIGLMRSVALELAPFGVRCNAICPSTVDTGMVNWQGSYDLGVGHEGGTREEFTESVRGMHALAQAAVLPPEVVAEAALWLASDGASAITGVVLPVDAGHSLLPRINMAPVV